MHKKGLKKIDLKTAYVVRYSVSTNSNVLKRNIVFSGKLFLKVLFLQFIFIRILHYILHVCYIVLVHLLVSFSFVMLLF